MINPKIKMQRIRCVNIMIGDEVGFVVHQADYEVPEEITWREVKGFTTEGQACVEFAGYDNYVLQDDEVKEVR